MYGGPKNWKAAGIVFNSFGFTILTANNLDIDLFYLEDKKTFIKKEHKMISCVWTWIILCIIDEQIN